MQDRLFASIWMLIARFHVGTYRRPLKTQDRAEAITETRVLLAQFKGKFAFIRARSCPRRTLYSKDSSRMDSQLRSLSMRRRIAARASAAHAATTGSALAERLSVSATNGLNV